MYVKILCLVHTYDQEGVGEVIFKRNQVLDFLQGDCVAMLRPRVAMVCRLNKYFDKRFESRRDSLGSRHD